MNLFKANPVFLFQIIFAIVTTVFAAILALFFARNDIPKFFPTTKNEETQTENFTSASPLSGFDKFGVIYVALDSPSFAQSNFDVNPNTTIELYFNEEVNSEDVADKLAVVKLETGEEVGIKTAAVVRDSTDTEGDKSTWRGHWKSKIIIMLQETLAPVAKYAIKLDAGVKNSTSSLFTVNSFIYNFMTADEPGVLSANIENGAALPEDGLVKIIFKSPMDTFEIEDSFSLFPQVTTLDLHNNDKVFTLGADFVTGHSYTLVIPAETMDIYGRALGEDFVLDFSVR